MRFSGNLVLHTIGENVVNKIRVFRMKMAASVAIIEDVRNPWRDSNPQPGPFEGTALTIELQGQLAGQSKAESSGLEKSSVKASDPCSWTTVDGLVLAVSCFSRGGLFLLGRSSHSVGFQLLALTCKVCQCTSFAAARLVIWLSGGGVGSQTAVRGNRLCDGNGHGERSMQAATAGRGAGWGIRPAAKGTFLRSRPALLASTTNQPTQPRSNPYVNHCST